MSAPDIGELVVYHHPDGRVLFAEVIRVTFWDVIDLRLGDGTELKDVRRAFRQDEGEEILGRFDRL